MKAIKFIVLVTILGLIGCSRDKYQFDASGNFEVDEVIVSAEASG